MKQVYIGMVGDYIHVGHINIINVGKKYEYVTVGLLTDKAVISYKREPQQKFKDREKIVKSIIGVNRVVEQTTLDYVPNLKRYKPDYVIHGDDWKKGVQTKIRDDVINVLKQWNGKLIEPSYTKGISSTKIIEDLVRVSKQSHNDKIKEIFDDIELHRRVGTPKVIIEDFEQLKQKHQSKVSGNH